MTWAADVADAFGDLLTEVGVMASWTDADAEIHEPLVLYAAPGTEILGGMQITNDHHITYRDADLPGLAHGAQLTVDGVQYAVREVVEGADPVISTARLKTV